MMQESYKFNQFYRMQPTVYSVRLISNKFNVLLLIMNINKLLIENKKNEFKLIKNLILRFY
jgi:hypothetical protein